jgi:beta-glucanase (GH16 family)
MTPTRDRSDSAGSAPGDPRDPDDAAPPAVGSAARRAQVLGSLSAALARGSRAALRRRRTMAMAVATVLAVALAAVLLTVLREPSVVPLASNPEGCAVGGVPAPCLGRATTGRAGWGTPAFDDEFTGAGLNTGVWAGSCPEFGRNLNGGLSSPGNVTVTDGQLALIQGAPGVGACVTTRPHEKGYANTGFTFQYGYAEARISFPGSAGAVYDWPAFWTGSDPWPDHGEIDIAEGIGGQLQSNYHAGMRCSSCEDGASTNLNSGGVSGGWAGGAHVYGVDREPGRNTVYWDGQKVFSYATSDGGAPEWFLLNVGDGAQGGQKVVGATVRIDYVRVWTRP